VIEKVVDEVIPFSIGGMSMVRQEIQEVINWLNTHAHREIEIHKVEDEDVDVVQLFLDHTTFRQIERHDPDDYLSDYAIMLHGQGHIQGAIQAASLPQAVYEIPVAEGCFVELEGDKLRISTQRAVYLLHSKGQ
jgi:hypothetical protein